MSVNKSIFYENSIKYWADIPPTIDGVLGGFGFISKVDIEASKLFLESLLESDYCPCPGKIRALDCGAGIGRVTKHLLLPNFDCVDVVEPIQKFTNAIKQYANGKLGAVYNVGLQDFLPTTKYNVIWIQWVLGYLTDDDMVAFLKRCRNALTINGIIIVKENVTSSGNLEYDDTDSSVTRSLEQFCCLFKKAKLKTIKQRKQKNFPKGIYPVYMFAFVPEISIENIDSNENINTRISEKLNSTSKLLDDLQKLNIGS